MNRQGSSHGLRATVLLLVLALPLLSAEVAAQAPADTVAVLTLVGKYFRLNTTPPWAVMADSPPRQSASSTVRALADTLDGSLRAQGGRSDGATVSPRYARMLMRGAGPVMMLSRAPETPCDSVAMDSVSGIHRPWIGASIRVTSVRFEDRSAFVLAQIDNGTRPCRSQRDVGWWQFSLAPESGVWTLRDVRRVDAP